MKGSCPPRERESWMSWGSKAEGEDFPKLKGKENGVVRMLRREVWKKEEKMRRLEEEENGFLRNLERDFVRGRIESVGKKV